MYKITTLCCIILLFPCLGAKAMMKSKPALSRQPVQTTHLRNALTDVSLTPTLFQNDESPTYVHIDLRDVPDGKDEMYHSTYHGKHVRGIIFLSLAGTFAITGAILAKNDDGDGYGIIGAILCGLIFIAFGIPGAILLSRYPHNRPKSKE